MKTTKEEILKQISKLEDEIQILRKKAENIDPKVEVWEDLEEIDGCYINVQSKVVNVTGATNYEENINIFKTEKHAKKALAMAQISQLMPYYGGEITNDEWENDNTYKYSLKRIGNNIRDMNVSSFYFLTFHTEEQREEFLKNNLQLVKDYLMID